MKNNNARNNDECDFLVSLKDEARRCSLCLIHFIFNRCLEICCTISVFRHVFLLSIYSSILILFFVNKE